MQDLSLHILDVAENGIMAGADRVSIRVEEDLAGDRLVITIEDNGRGMEEDFLKAVLDPFTTTRTTRKVGMGLSLFHQAALAADGDLELASEAGKGTVVKVFMSHGHIDRKPMGDMAETMVTLIEGNPHIDFVYSHLRNGREYRLDTRELREDLEEIPINHPQVVQLIRENLHSGLQEISAE